MKGVTQNKPRLGQGRTDIKWKIKLPLPPLLNKPITQVKEKSVLQQPQNITQPQITMKVQVPESSQVCDKFIPVPNYIIPQTRSGDYSNSRTVKRKTIQDISREIPAYTDPIFGSPPIPTEIPLQEILR